MSKRLKSEDRRVFDELLEMAQALDEHGLLTKHDYAKMKTLCLEKPPLFTPKKVTDIRIHQARMRYKPMNL